MYRNKDDIGFFPSDRLPETFNYFFLLESDDSHLSVHSEINLGTSYLYPESCVLYDYMEMEELKCLLGRKQVLSRFTCYRKMKKMNKAHDREESGMFHRICPERSYFGKMRNAVQSLLQISRTISSGFLRLR